jgi:hypothetical protein
MTASVTLDSSDKLLRQGFHWAKTQALAYVFPAAATGDPVGDWYEAALPGRAAFCMRDVSHQSTGAHVLGFAAYTYNMLHKFAANIAASRDWCTYWEIDRHDRPAPVDYQSDEDFWYNLPANFDVLHCCYRQYLWTGDRRYLDDRAFRNFYARTVSDYVQRWDKDGDGIPEYYRHYGRRGIASYNEAVTRPFVGGDLIAAQAAAYDAYAALLAVPAASTHGFAADSPSAADPAQAWRAKAQALRTTYDREWWCASSSRFAGLRLHDLRYECGYCAIANFFPLYLNLIEDKEKAEYALADVIRRRRQHGVEDRSYLPELFYAYGHPLVAHDDLMEQLEPGYDRREYPEVSYAAIGSIVTGMLGIAPDARTHTLTTCSRLTSDTRWVQISSMPCLDNIIDVRHDGQDRTVLTNHEGPPLQWEAVFPGHLPQLLLDGAPHRPNWSTHAHGQLQSVLRVPVAAHSTHTVEVP